MEGVVERGTATGAKLEGYQVAGKTGTASKLVDGHYSHTEYNVSFVGFVPAHRPALTILVVIDTPRNGSPYGPATRPVIETPDGRPVMPDVRGLSARDALRVLGKAGLFAVFNGSGIVATQTPAAGQPIESGGTGVLELRRIPPSDPSPIGGGPR